MTKQGGRRFESCRKRMAPKREVWLATLKKYLYKDGGWVFSFQSANGLPLNAGRLSNR